MSYTTDVNVLLAASHTRSTNHKRAVEFLERAATGPELFYVFWPTIMGYLRITTNPRIMQDPESLDRAVVNVNRLISERNVRAPGEGERFWEVYQGVAADGAPRANLVPDSHIVGLMLEHGVRTIWTNDRDFRRFRSIEAKDPFA